MTGSDRPPRLRGHRAQSSTAALSGSCELLLQLAQSDQVYQLLSRAGVRTDHLEQSRHQLAQSLPPEPADWLHRISARGARGRHASELDHLLAILRSADCHAYRLLERSGIDLSALRRRVIETLSQQNLDQLKPKPARQSHFEHPPELASPRSSVRASQARAQKGDPVRPSLADGPPAIDRLPAIAPRPSPRRSQHPAAPEPGKLGALRNDSGNGSGSGPPPLPLREESPGRSSQGPPLPPPSSPVAQASPSLAPSSTSGTTARHRVSKLRLEPLLEAELGPLFGRDRQLQGLADAVGRERPRPPLLVGERGSGRTLLCKHLCRVLDSRVYHLSLPQFLAQDPLRQALDGIAKVNGVVVIDDLDRVASEAAPDFLSELVSCWVESRPRCVTICSHETRSRLAQWLPGILAGLDSILLEPLEMREVQQAVSARAPEVLTQHGLCWGGNELAEYATRIAERYLSGLAQPGRSLDLIDLASARALRQGQAQLQAQQLREVVAQRTGLPLGHIHGTQDQELLELEATLAERVVGHERAISRICALVRRNRAGFRSERPIGSVLLLGPSGIGKTEIAKSLALALYSQEDSLLRLDMSEFSEAHAVARIVGAPPGYVGHEHGGALADAMIERPHRVLLLDEIEKAHRDVHQLFLQIFDEGRLTDGRGRILDFRHCLIIMTSNLGAELIAAQPPSIKPSPDPSPELRDAVLRVFPVELWNRIEAPLALHPLQSPELTAILERLAQRSSDQLLAERDVSFTLSGSTLKWLLDLAGQDPALGARPLRHLLQRHIESALADALLGKRIEAGMHVEINWKRRTLHLQPRIR